MIEYIERMRKEPPAVRRRAVVTWTTVIVTTIALFYITNLMVRGTILVPTRTAVERTSTIAAPYEAAQ